MASADEVQLEAPVKLRREKKWKSRYFVVSYSPENGATVHVYKNHKSRKKEQNCKKIANLNGYIGFESGFELDKESHTLAILSESVQSKQCGIVAFETQSVLIEWEQWLRNNLGKSSQFPVRVISCPEESDLSTELDCNVRLHVYDGVLCVGGSGRFCISSGCPPQMVSCWTVSQLRRYGPLHNKFCFEAGKRAGPNRAGMHMLLTCESERIHQVFCRAAHNSKGVESQQLPTEDCSTPKESKSTTLPPEPIPPGEKEQPGPSWAGTERRPLLESNSSNTNISNGPPAPLTLPEGYANEVFESSVEPTPVSPQPFIYPGHGAQSYKRVGVSNCVQESTESNCCCECHHPLPVNVLAPTTCQNCHGNATHIWVPSPAVIVRPRAKSAPPNSGPPLEARIPVRNSVCQVCTGDRNYMNQRFIDSLQYYYNFDAVFFPCSPGVLQTVPQGYMCMEPAYVPFEPATPQAFEPSVTPPPEDPGGTPSYTAVMTSDSPPLPKKSPEEIQKLVQSRLPPYTPRMPFTNTLPARHNKEVEKQPVRRAISTTYTNEDYVSRPDSQGSVSTWSQGGTGRRRSRSVFSLRMRNKSSSSSLSSKRGVSPSLHRGGLLRESSRRARRLLGSFLKIKKDRDKHRDTHTPDDTGLDLDDPVYSAQGSSNPAPPVSPIWERRHRKQGLIIPASEDLRRRSRLVPSVGLDTILDTSASSAEQGSNTTTDSGAVNNNRVDPLKHCKGVSLSRTSSRPATPVRQFTEPLRGSYSIYDGDPYRKSSVTASNQKRPFRVNDEIGRAIVRMQQQQSKIAGIVMSDANPSPPSAGPGTPLPPPPGRFPFPDNPSLNYCDIWRGNASDPVPPTPRTAMLDEERTNYVPIDQFATMAVKEIRSDYKNRSSSTHTIERKESGPSSLARKFLKKRGLSGLSRQASMNSLAEN